MSIAVDTKVYELEAKVAQLEKMISALKAQVDALSMPPPQQRSILGLGRKQPTI